MAEPTTFTIHLEQIEGYEFKVRFDWHSAADLLLDEPEPLGRSAGPNAARLLAAAVGNCLCASLMFCMRKFKQEPGPLTARVTCSLARNERGRIRVGELAVSIRLAEPREHIQHFDRCIQQFEDFCIVTDSVRHGIPVHVEVVDSSGAAVYTDRSTPVPA